MLVQALRAPIPAFVVALASSRTAIATVFGVAIVAGFIITRVNLCITAVARGSSDRLAGRITDRAARRTIITCLGYRVVIVALFVQRLD